MKLHQDTNAFRVLIEDIHNKTGYRTDVLEKDYYVVLMLEELAAKQKEGLPAYFKGGTALYKALKSTNRFSEDIDLSVDTRGCNNTQNNKRLEAATKKYDALPRDREQGKTNRSEVITVYTYEPITNFDANDSLQRFGKLKIEATSFTISEPVTSLAVTPMLYDLATDEQKQILASVYDVKPFAVQTITIERIYDLTVLLSEPQIKALLCDSVQMARLLQIRMVEEQERRDGIPGVLPKEFRFFTEAANNSKVKNAYETMQRQYVLRDSECIAYETAMQALSNIQSELFKNPAWMECRLPEDSTY